MKKIIPNGTEVLIFFDSKNCSNNDVEKSFIKGVVISSKMSEDLSCHGSPWYEQIYTVKGENDNIYEATYLISAFEEFYIRTIEDYINYLNYKIKENHKKIINIEKENQELVGIIESFIPRLNESHEVSVAPLSSDSEYIAKLVESFKFDPTKTDEVGEKHEDLLKRTRHKKG